MPKIIVTPWRNEIELLDVRSKFYPPSATSSLVSTFSDQRADACRIVEAWKLRGHLPHAVESTALLTDAILHDDSTRNSVFSISATYTAAFSRFVTGFVDTKLGGLQRGTTMFNRAASIGLPLSFVELRHQAAHRELPSLVLLRNYTNRGLEWLWDNYWARIDQGFGNSMVKTGVDYDALRDQVTTMLQQFQRQMHSENSKKRSKLLIMTLSQSLSSCCRIDDLESIEVVCRVFLEGGFLVPNERQLATSMDDLFSLWNPVLQLILEESVAPFLNALVEGMVKILSRKPDRTSTTEDPYLEGLYLWLEHILTSQTWRSSSIFCSRDYLRLCCSEWTNSWTKKLLQLSSSGSELSQIDNFVPDQPMASAEDSIDSESIRDLRNFGWEY